MAASMNKISKEQAKDLLEMVIETLDLKDSLSTEVKYWRARFLLEMMATCEQKTEFMDGSSNEFLSKTAEEILDDIVCRDIASKLDRISRKVPSDT